VSLANLLSVGGGPAERSDNVALKGFIALSKQHGHQSFKLNHYQLTAVLNERTFHQATQLPRVESSPGYGITFLCLLAFPNYQIVRIC
jgi:hypothetical protein